MIWCVILWSNVPFCALLYHRVNMYCLNLGLYTNLSFPLVLKINGHHSHLKLTVTLLMEHEKCNTNSVMSINYINSADCTLAYGWSVKSILVRAKLPMLPWCCWSFSCLCLCVCVRVSVSAFPQWVILAFQWMGGGGGQLVLWMSALQQCRSPVARELCVHFCVVLCFEHLEVERV